MIYTTHYSSPLVDLLLACQDNALIGLWIEGQKYYLSKFNDIMEENNDLEIFHQTKKWFDHYFEGKKPSIDELNLSFIGTDFRKKVWKILCEIPYGKTITYKEIAMKIAKEKRLEKMSAQAIGGAVGHNPISIIVPCHRVVGSDGSLVGYAGGIDKKMTLLQHEKVDISKFYIPNIKKDVALKLTRGIIINKKGV